jgi:hypothetical protein
MTRSPGAACAAVNPALAAGGSTTDGLPERRGDRRDHPATGNPA